MCKVQCAKVSVFYEEWNVYAVNNLTLPFQTCSFIDFMRSFASDNNSSVHPKVMEMLMKANEGHAVGYGDDPWTEEATRLVKQQFSRPCEALFVFNGTGSNTMALQLMTRPYHIIFCADTGHIAVDECGAPSKGTGCFMRTIPTKDGKLTPELLAPYMINFGVEHHSQPGAVYISQCTELGTVYTPDEVKALCEFAHSHGLKVHMDGARISNAAAALGVSIDEVSGACGVDTLTLGGTKNGLMGAECVVVFNPELMDEARYARKQTCQLASKMRYLSAQFIAFLTDELWRTCAEHANRLAQKLHDALAAMPDVQFTQKMESNQLFFIMPKEKEEKLHEKYYFYYWNEAIGEMRLVTSWDTTEEDVDGLIEYVKRL
jgi:threonine aldolase